MSSLKLLVVNKLEKTVTLHKWPVQPNSGSIISLFKFKD